jgi:hypothetical protein
MLKRSDIVQIYLVPTRRVGMRETPSPLTGVRMGNGVAVGYPSASPLRGEGWDEGENPDHAHA